MPRVLKMLSVKASVRLDILGNCRKGVLTKNALLENEKLRAHAPIFFGAYAASESVFYAPEEV